MSKGKKITLKILTVLHILGLILSFLLFENVDFQFILDHTLHQTIGFLFCFSMILLAAD